MRILNPSHISALMAIYCLPQAEQESAGLNMGVARMLRESGLIDYTGPNVWGLTERGKKYLDMLLATPLPVSQWVDPREEEEND